MEVGDNLPPDSLLGPNPELALYSLDSFRLAGADNDAAASAVGHRAARRCTPVRPRPCRQPADTTLDAIDTVAGMGQASDYVPAGGATYDNNSALAGALRDVARLIKAKVGLQIACIDYGDWDMHVGLGLANTAGNIGGTDDNWMRDHLDELAKALAAFGKDLSSTPRFSGDSGSFLDDVSLVSLTEFGRRAEENGDHGVDHGFATAVMLMGSGVDGWAGPPVRRLADAGRRCADRRRPQRDHGLPEHPRRGPVQALPSLDFGHCVDLPGLGRLRVARRRLAQLVELGRRLHRQGLTPSSCSAARAMLRAMPPNTNPWNGATRPPVERGPAGRADGRRARWW